MEMGMDWIIQRKWAEWKEKKAEDEAGGASTWEGLAEGDIYRESRVTVMNLPKENQPKVKSQLLERRNVPPAGSPHPSIPSLLWTQDVSL